jgi:predicted amidohydrolase
MNTAGLPNRRHPDGFRPRSGPQPGRGRPSDRRGRRRRARLAVLPEYFPLITGDETAKVRIREQEGEGPLQDFLRDAARRHKVWLMGGSCPLAADSPDKVKNSTLVFDDTGRRVARYDKVHLFGFRKGEECYDESATIEAGNEVVAFEAPCGQVGLSICYDLRFPETFPGHGRGGS